MPRKTIRLKPGKYKSGHPWVFARQIAQIAPGISAGDIVFVVDSRGELIGKGYFNPASDIAARLLTFFDEEINKSFFEKRISDSWEKREEILKQTNACRAVFSEADALPGLIVDLYADTAVFQILTLGMEKFKETIAACLKELLPVKYIYERSDALVREIEGLPLITGWWGKEGADRIEIYEGKAKFLIDIVAGHKTGFYLDQRQARQALRRICGGKRVLDLFSYCAGFAINAALGSAASVQAVDIKQYWLELGRKNARLNGVEGKIDFIKADAFDFLRKLSLGREKYGVVVVDPPSFLKSRHQLANALAGYREINSQAMKVLDKEGVLCTFSCSHNMSNELFAQMLKSTARSLGRGFTILKRCHQDKDHPYLSRIPETNYLKGYFLKMS